MLLVASDSEILKDEGFETFSTVIANYFEIPVRIVTRDARLDDDLGFDSIGLLECVLMLEEVAGHELDLDAIETVRTIGDLFNFFWQFASETIIANGPHDQI